MIDSSNFFHRVIQKALRTAGKHFPFGTNIYSRDWDLCIILDACRYDLIREVEEDYQFLENPGYILSLASESKSWMNETFTNDHAKEMASTAYITGNPYSAEVLDAIDLEILDEVWRYAWDEELGTIHPRPITDRAITTHRTQDPERLIVHYMQPHFPFLSDRDLHRGIDLEYFGNLPWDSIWKRLERGEIERDRIWKASRENLKIVLNDVEVLIQNIDADSVVITADHGNAMGEWGIYGHPKWGLQPKIRQVPWYNTEAEDTETYYPKTKRAGDSGRLTIESRLKSLGYK